jgi:hypothetical protein
VEQAVLQDFLQILQEIWILVQVLGGVLLVQAVEAVEQVGDLFQELHVLEFQVVREQVKLHMDFI